MTKSELRKTYLQKRASLTHLEYSDYSQQLCNQFFTFIDLVSIKVLHVFLPIKKNKEPDTWLIIDKLKKDYPHIRISLPRITIDNQLESYYYDDGCMLQENKLGILEPINGTITKSKEIDLVIIPLLAFDSKGNRVGYGKGYYDRFLASCKNDCKKIGLSFFNGVETIDDVNEFDVPLDKCVTSTSTHSFKKK